jgi:hypothetical protein
MEIVGRHDIGKRYRNFSMAKAKKKLKNPVLNRIMQTAKRKKDKSTAEKPVALPGTRYRRTSEIPRAVFLDLIISLGRVGDRRDGHDDESRDVRTEGMLVDLWPVEDLGDPSGRTRDIRWESGFNTEGRLIGLEFLSASKRYSSSDIFNLSTENLILSDG